MFSCEMINMIKDHKINDLISINKRTGVAASLFWPLSSISLLGFIRPFALLNNLLATTTTNTLTLAPFGFLNNLPGARPVLLDTMIHLDT